MVARRRAYLEPSPAERRKILTQLFDRVWQHGGIIVAVTPRGPFARYFAATDARQMQAKTAGVKGGSDGGQTRERHLIEIR